MSYKVVSISNRQPDAWYYLFWEFMRSLNDTPPMVLQPSHWGGLSTKPKVLYQAITQKLIDAKYIIFCDCWDLVFATTPNEVMERYFTFGCPIVISSEKNCFPADLKEQYDSLDAPTPYKYLNSGFIVGETEAILTCLEAMDLPNLPDDHYDPIKQCNVHPNDQFEWMKIFIQQPVEIKLDYRQELSQTLHDASVDDFDFTKSRIKNKLTNSEPCVFHFNGGSKDDMKLREPILSKLNLL